jgi:hypothetical protein
VVGSIPPGSGYTIALTGTSTDGAVTCSGFTAFLVVPYATTAVTAALSCSGTSPDSGADSGPPPSSCAEWQSVSANPSEVAVGMATVLTAVATGPNVDALTYAWSAPSGTFSSPHSTTTRFTCTVAGPVTVTFTVSDGPVPDGGSCNTALSTTTFRVVCDP